MQVVTSKRVLQAWVAAFGLIAGGVSLASLSGCTSAGGNTLLGISPLGTGSALSATLIVDAGQTVPLYASVVNDNGAGVTWAVTGAGSLSGATASGGQGGNSTFASDMYVAPATASSQMKATVTATSVKTPAQVGTFNITVNPAIQFVTASPLPNGALGVAYTAQIVANGGTAPLAYSVAPSTLPTGLSITSAGLISGTPSAAGTFTFPVTVTDGATVPNAVSQTYSITVLPAITTRAVLNAVVGVPYGASGAGVQLAYLGGGTPTFAVASGSLPASSGLTLSSGGLISGTPAAGTAGNVYTFGVTVTVGGATSVPVTFSITVTNLLMITTTSPLPGGSVGAAYAPVQLAATGGTNTGYVYSLLTSGTSAPPPGLTISTGGLLSFATTPTLAGTYTFTVGLVDSAAATATKVFTLTVAASTLTITTTSLPSGNTGVAYSQQLAIMGGSGNTPTFSISSGSLSGSGLTLSASGLISGTPIANGLYTFSVTVAEAGATASMAQPLTISISNLSITSGTSAFGEVNLPFSFPEQVRGGTGPYTWTATNGGAPLPAGLTVTSATGQITGTPTAATSSPANVQIQVTDSIGNFTTQAVAITVNAARTNANNSQLNGQYAFLLTGYNSPAGALTVVGELVFDGAGHVTGGMYDSNGFNQNTPSVSQVISSGTYSLGSDNRGRATLVTPSGTLTFVISANKATAGVAKSAYMTEFDSSGQNLTGSLTLSDPTAFNSAAFSGGFAFGLAGFNGSPAIHAGTIGEFQMNSGAGTISGFQYLSTATGLSVQQLSGANTQFAVAANGRGTMTLANSSFNLSLVFYVVSANQMYVASAAPIATAQLVAGTALKQTISGGNFTGAALNGTAVARIQRLDQAGTTLTPDVSLGVMNFSTPGSVTFTGDENAGGAASQFSTTGAVTVGAFGIGSVPLSAGLGGCVLCANTSTYFALVGANQGFILDFQGGTGTGYFEPQSTTAFTAGSLSGTYAGGTVNPLSQSAVYSGQAYNANGTGSLTGTQDLNTNDLLIPNQALTATYTAAASGRVVLTTTDGTMPVLYLVSPTKAIRMDLGATLPVLSEVIQ